MILTRIKRYAIIKTYQKDTQYHKQKGERTMDEKIYYSAEEISKMLGVSLGMSYKLLREMNADLKAKGYLTIAGKIPVEYFKEKWYGSSSKGVGA